MNRNHVFLLVIAVLTIPLIALFIPESKTGTIESLEGVTLSTVDGQKFKLSGIFAEKPLLLVFWSIRCGTCIEEIPFLTRLHQQWRDKLTIIGIHPPGYPIKQIQKFLRQYPEKIPYQLAIDDEQKLLTTYQVSVLPQTVLVNTRGKVLYSHVGYSPEMEGDMEHAIKSHL
jgi:cytochrome c biogenesis protein CcmG, thiol:disulfide interchange protein DsbE